MLEFLKNKVDMGECVKYQMAPLMLMLSKGAIIPFQRLLPPIGVAGDGAEHFFNASGLLQASSVVPDTHDSSSPIGLFLNQQKNGTGG